MIALKKLLSVVLLLVLFIGGFFIYLKAAPPLVTGTIEKSEDNRSVVIEIGNKGLKDLKVTSVRINNNANPKDVKIQVSNQQKDLAALTDGRGEAENLEGIENISISKGTNPEEKGTGYRLIVSYDEGIHNVHIKYRYFGILFNDTVEIE